MPIQRKITQLSRRTSHLRRRSAGPPSFFKLFLLIGSALLLLLLFSFMAGSMLVFPHSNNPGSTQPTSASKDQKSSSSAVIWTSKTSKNYYGCSEPSAQFLSQFSSQSSGYLVVEASGGLNQQRTGIIDAVVAARILNATLVVPCLDHASFWKDNRLEENLQKLRCKVNYHALQFTKSINIMGSKLVERLRQRNERYIALHLRFEPDMLAFTGCYYGGGEKEINDMAKLRKQWKNIPHRNPEKARRNGRCPLTPEEVGLMLRALGYGSDTYLYVASGEIYGGETALAPLKQMFPNFFTKDTLATEDELGPFSAYSSRLAAIDFVVCDQSDVFVTNNNGNMARMLSGRRRYFGHKRTIRPNAKKLKTLFASRQNMTFEVFKAKLKRYQKGFMGDPMEMRPGRGQFFENPSACICKKSNRV